MFDLTLFHSFHSALVLQRSKSKILPHIGVNRGVKGVVTSHFLELLLAAILLHPIPSPSNTHLPALEIKPFQKGPFSKHFPLEFVLESFHFHQCFGCFSVDDRRKLIKKYVFSYENELALSRPLRTFARKFSNIDFFLS